MSHPNVRVTNLDVNLKHVYAAADGQLAVNTDAVSAPALDKNTKAVLYTCEGNVRVRFDGVAPTASVGLKILNGSSASMGAALWGGAKFISADGAAATISYTQLA